MSKSKAVKKSLETEVKEKEVKADVDVLLVEFTKSLQLDDDFVLIENTPSAVIPCQDRDHLDSSRRRDVNTHIFNIAQTATNTESSGTAEESLLNPTENQMGIPAKWEKEVLVDQKYWERNEADTQRGKSTRMKYPASQRLTVTELNKIEKNKTVSRDPCHYKFNISTTATLKALIDKEKVNTYHNVLGKGNSSVVIHAYYLGYDSHGLAVKVYKLSNDIKNNNAILKRARREYELLLTLTYCWVPQVSYRLKNVIIMSFLGNDQEPFPALSSLPSEYCKNVYQILIEQIKKWYTVHSIVHGKLCTKSILYETTVGYYHNSIPCRPWVIGWGHSVKRDHPRALMKLMRDCHFITKFFGSRDVPVKTTTELFKDVTGLEEVSSKLLDAVYKSDLWQEGLLTNPNRP